MEKVDFRSQEKPWLSNGATRIKPRRGGLLATVVGYTSPEVMRKKINIWRKFATGRQGK